MLSNKLSPAKQVLLVGEVDKPQWTIRCQACSTTTESMVLCLTLLDHQSSCNPTKISTIWLL